LTTEATINYWPLVLIVEDCYVPALAQSALDACAALDSETIAAGWVCDAFAAEVDAESRRN
jgi:hypothetical protein